MCQQLSELIFNNIHDGVFTVDRDCIITSFNRSAERITGFKAEEAFRQALLRGVSHRGLPQEVRP